MNKRTLEPKALIILDGDLSKLLPVGVRISQYAYTLAVDGALDKLLEVGVIPDAVAGDFDSVLPETLVEFRKGGGIVDHQTDQESGDFEKALLHMKRKGIFNLDVIGYQGSRFDHTLGVFHAAIKYLDEFKFIFHTDICEAYLLGSGEKMVLDDQYGNIVSLIPLLNCKQVTLDGFRWNLTNSDLELGKHVSLSNEVHSANATIQLDEGVLLIVVYHQGKDELG
ncbi:thiamine diphosphokinase [bacterium]|nr:thiamine diphosphokinase [bacterium]